MNVSTIVHATSRREVRRLAAQGLLVALLLTTACAGDSGHEAEAEPGADVVAAQPEETEPAELADEVCRPPAIFPPDLPVPPCERQVGRAVVDPGSVSWIMVSTLAEDGDVKAFFDDRLAAAGFEVEELTPPMPGTYVLRVSGHGITEGTIRFGSNDITAPMIRFDLKGDLGG